MTTKPAEETILELLQRYFTSQEEAASLAASNRELRETIRLALRECPTCKGKTGMYVLCPQCFILQNHQTIEEDAKEHS